MKSGLEGRNNPHATPTICGARTRVSMKSGLEGRNNVCVDTLYENTSIQSQ